jgi:hypothetical protein
MRAYSCAVCGQLVFFENSACLRCGSELAFGWEDRDLVTRPTEPACANRDLIGCNWLAAAPGQRCFSCDLTRTRPPDGDPHGLGQLAKAEAAKRRLLLELGELGIAPTDGSLTFDLLSSAYGPVTTGHADGLITLDLAESDDAVRERIRTEMGEPYRTLLGHFRHEVGHYYFPVLVRTDADRERARALFGDEREDYQAALERHYEQGAPAGWENQHVSAYATMHPAEDWAETFAHVLHIRDALQTAAAYGVRVEGPAGRPDLRADPVDPAAAGLRAELGDWLGLTYALNAVNRSMGLDDLYPFVLAAPVIDKLAFVDELVAAGR